MPEYIDEPSQYEHDLNTAILHAVNRAMRTDTAQECRVQGGGLTAAWGVGMSTLSMARWAIGIDGELYEVATNFLRRTRLVPVSVKDFAADAHADKLLHGPEGRDVLIKSLIIELWLTFPDKKSSKMQPSYVPKPLAPDSHLW